MSRSAPLWISKIISPGTNRSASRVPICLYSTAYVGIRFRFLAKGRKFVVFRGLWPSQPYHYRHLETPEHDRLSGETIRRTRNPRKRKEKVMPTAPGFMAVDRPIALRRYVSALTYSDRKKLTYFIHIWRRHKTTTYNSWSLANLQGQE